MTVSLFQISQACSVAQVARIDELAHQIRNGGGLGLFNVIMAALIILSVLGLGISLARLARRVENRPFNDPAKLFNELSRAHRLNFWERALLRRVAQAGQISPPARLFLTAEAFDAEKLNLPRYEKSLTNLRNKLFEVESAEDRSSHSASD